MSVGIQKETLTLTATGSAGSSSVNGAMPREMTGWLYEVHIDYPASAPSTTVVEIWNAQDDHRCLKITGNSDGSWVPSRRVVGWNGTAVTNSYVPCLLKDQKPYIKIASTDNNVAIDIKVTVVPIVAPWG